METTLTKTADIRISARHAKIGVGVVALSMGAVFILQLLLARNLVTPAGTPVGGDFAAFWTAAKAMAAGEMTAIYDPVTFEAWLNRIAPAQERWGLSWQYPPTYFFVIGFLAYLPYGLGYAVWTGGSIAALAASAHASGLRHWPLVAVIFSPVAFHTAVTGQNGFLTAALFLGATLLPDKRPVVAGLCAAMLTVKPQLGVLLPFAFMAGGHWRAFSVAAMGAVALGVASYLAFGIAPWAAFFESVLGTTSRISTGELPLFKMPTLYAGLAMIGLPKSLALAAHILVALMAIAATVFVWRNSRSPALKAAVVCCGAFFVAPYAYYYELIIIAVPLALLAKDENGRPFDHLILAALFLLPMLLPGDPRQMGINYCLIVVSIAAFFILRRIKTDGASA
ncbi:glycosyltransferase family 87 protein [Hyphococcus sp. DH-69]|uniref:glycosyltransferase family 87 protein n=1 Tax=Hyphococcus formosus TaxID=3143534 RepID=UPI00398B5222